MEYQELILALVDETSYTKREVRRFLRTLAKLFQEAIASGRDVQFNGVGRFKNVQGAARVGRHPITGDPMRIPPCRRLRFRPCDQLIWALEKSEKLFQSEDLGKRFGLGNINGDQVANVGQDSPASRSAAILRGRVRSGGRHGKVRGRDRPEQGLEGKAGREGV